MKNQQSGFTLIELSAVLITLGILAFVALPRLLNLSDTAGEAAVHTTFNYANNSAQEWYRSAEKTETRWISFENHTGAKGNGGKENNKAKGHPAEAFNPGETKVLMDLNTGAGIIQRMWLTISDRSPAVLRAVKIEMYWDGNAKAAVSVPLGDFFGISLGRRVPFTNALFSDPEGRSFNATIPMPFRKGARITLTNESTAVLFLFYDIAYQQVEYHSADVLYFHAYWNRTLKSELGQDFEVLPFVKGRGRFLGTNMGIITNPLYEKSWWGEGEVKIFLDGDAEFPTLNGTGTEDYIGTAWGQGLFNHPYQGCLVADENTRQWTFYRYHIPDPVYFTHDIKVTIQNMGRDELDKVRKYVQNGAALIPVSVADKEFVKLLELPRAPNILDADFPAGWINFYRQDDVSATAYFYLDSPTSSLPAIQEKSIRIAELPEKY